MTMDKRDNLANVFFPQITIYKGHGEPETKFFLLKKNLYQSKIDLLTPHERFAKHA